MLEEKLTVEQYFSKFKKCPRLTFKYMSTENKTKTLTNIRKLLASNEFDTISEKRLWKLTSLLERRVLGPRSVQEP
jgi:hypothetical protein